MALGRRRRPWPYGLIVDGVQIPLIPDPKSGLLVGSKVQPLSSIQPTTQSYENWPAFRERTLAFSQMPMGFGHPIQIQDNQEKDAFYNYADCVDASIMTMWQKGPGITKVTPTTVDATNGILKFEEVTISSTKQLFAINGRYALERTGDTSAGWPVAKDFGVGNIAAGSTVITQNIVGAATRLLVAMGTATESWYTPDGTTWTQTTHGVKVDDFALLDYGGMQLYGTTGANRIAVCSLASDYTDFNNWSAVDLFRIGDQTKAVTRLAQTTHNALIVVKEDSIWTIRSDGQALNLFPALTAGQNAKNGYGWWLFQDTLYLPTLTTGLLGITPSGYFGTIAAAQEVGVEKIGDNTSPVRGQILCGEGSQFNAYAGIWNPDTNTSYVLKYGTRTTDASDPAQGQSNFLPVWHGSISHPYVGVQITAMKRSTVGAPANHERLYIGFSDGSIGWFTLPCTANPAGCSSYGYELTDCSIYMSSAHLGFKADNKNVIGASIFGPTLGSDYYAKVAFQVDTTSPWKFTGGDSTIGSPYQSNGGSRYDLDKPLFSRMVNAKVVLTSTQTATSPQVSALAIHHMVVPALVLEVSGTADARPFAILRDGRPSRLPPQAVKDAMQNAAGAPLSTWILPTENEVTVELNEYSFIESPDVRGGRIGWLIPFKAVQYKALTVYGTWARIQQVNWSQLNTMSWSSIQTL